MMEQNSYTQMAEIVRFHMQEMADLLRTRFVQVGAIHKVAASAWSNESGIIVGSISVWSGEDTAEDSIDGVLTVTLAEQDVKIQADVCQTDGVLLLGLFEQEEQFGTQDELTKLVKASIQTIMPELVSAMMAVVGSQKE